MGFEIELTIDRLSKTGEGIGIHAGRAVFVEGALPGERVRVLLQEDAAPRRSDLLGILLSSPNRRAPACPLSEVCGGCGWLHFDEAAQRQAKLEIVLSTLEHLGRIARSAVQVLTTLASPRQLAYRRRAVMHQRGARLCFFGRRSRRAVPIDRCPAMDEALSPLPGLLSPFLARLAKDIDEVHLLSQGNRVAFAIFLRSARSRPAHRRACEEAIAALRLSGAVVVPKESSPILIGEPVLRTTANPPANLPLYSRPDAFAQANAQANDLLVRSVLASLDASRTDRVLELYCGNGNFTFGITARGALVTAVEQSAVALQLARRCAREGDVSNLRFIQGDCDQVCAGLVRDGAKFDRILVDPPRTGAVRLAHWADRLGARAITYVACDPAALARDAGRLVSAGFTPGTLQLVDLFPQTPHVEVVMSFAR